MSMFERDLVSLIFVNDFAKWLRRVDPGNENSDGNS